MRTWGRIPLKQGASGIGEFIIGVSAIGYEGVFGTVDISNPSTYVWQEVTTDANGYNDQVWETTLSQVLQLGLNESPIFGNYGIPAQQSAVTETQPDYYVSLTQQQFSQYFVSLTVFKNSSTPPTYSINAVPHTAAIMMNPVPV